jgi:hypothetical protein
MKDFFSAFSSDFFWPLATLLLPGMLALTPGAIAILWIYPSNAAFVQANQIEVGLVFITVATFIGLVLEDIGARLELIFFDLAKNSSWEDWYDYLKSSDSERLIAHKYIHTFVLRLKFELGCISATPFVIFGIWFWPIGLCSKAISTLIVSFLVSYLSFEAFSGVEMLSDIRKNVFRPQEKRKSTK